MTNTPPPAGELRYATDITQADISAVHDFLNARIAPQINQATGDARRTARALQDLARDAYARATVHLRRLDELDFAERHTTSRMEELHALRDAWNRLHQAAEHWQDHQDFNPRWRHIHYTDTDAELREQEVDAAVRARLAATQAGTDKA